MDISETMLSEHHKHWTRERQELYLWFQRNAPSLGELYAGALRMLYDESGFPGRTRFIAHAVREIRNRLPEVIAGGKSKPSVQYKNRLDDLSKKWQKHSLPLDGTLPIDLNAPNDYPANVVLIPREVALEVATLIKDHEEAREKPVDAAKRLFEALAPENDKERDNLYPVIKQWIETTDWFISKAHDSGRTDNDIWTDEFQKKFELFERILGSLIWPFYQCVEELDEILEETNA